MGLGTVIGYEKSVMNSNCSLNVNKEENSYSDIKTAKQFQRCLGSSAPLVNVSSAAISTESIVDSVLPHSFISENELVPQADSLLLAVGDKSLPMTMIRRGSVSLPSWKGSQNLNGSASVSCNDQLVSEDGSWHNDVNPEHLNSCSSIPSTSGCSFSHTVNGTISTTSSTETASGINRNGTRCAAVTMNSHYESGGVSLLKIEDAVIMKSLHRERDKERTSPLSSSSTSSIVLSNCHSYNRCNTNSTQISIGNALNCTLDGASISSKNELVSCVNSKKFPKLSSSAVISSNNSVRVGIHGDESCLPSDQLKNKDLQILLQDSPTHTRNYGSNRLASPPSMKQRQSVMSSSSGQEISKRRTIQERIDRLRNSGALKMDMIDLEKSNSTQLAMIMRRFKKHVPIEKYISNKIVRHVFETDSATTSSRDFKYDEFRKSSPKLFTTKSISDSCDCTEVSSSEEEDDYQWNDGCAIPSTSTRKFSYSTKDISSKPMLHMSRNLAAFRFYDEQTKMGAMDAQIATEINYCEKEIIQLKLRLEEIRSKKESVFAEIEPDEMNCSRCLRFKSHHSCKMYQMSSAYPPNVNDATVRTSMTTTASSRLSEYAHIDNRVHPWFSFFSSIPVDRRMELYLKRLSTRPEQYLRKRSDVPLWAQQSSTETAADSAVKQHKQSAVKCEEARKRNYKRLNSSNDDMDDNCTPWKIARKNQINKRHSTSLKRAHRKLVRRSFDQKRFKEQRKTRLFLPNKSKDISTFLTDIDDTLPGLPQKIDYKEITIPNYTYAPLSLLTDEIDDPCNMVALYTTPLEIVKRHLPLEMEERKRFQQYRDHASKTCAAEMIGELNPLGSTRDNTAICGSDELTGGFFDHVDKSNSKWSDLDENGSQEFIKSSLSHSLVRKPFSPRMYCNLSPDRNDND